MGAWGSESCSSDSCWDNLWAENIHKMTQAEADNSLKKAFAQKTQFKDHIDTDQMAAQLGVVIWILRHGLKVQEQYLSKGKLNASVLLGDKEYIQDWKRPEERIANLRREISDISDAIQNGGVGKTQHMPGLFEKIALGMGAK